MTTAVNENDFNSLVSIIKIEPEEFQASQESSTSVSDEVLRQRAKIFSDPVLLLERVAFDQKFPFDRQSALKLAEKGNEGKNKFEKQTCSICKRVLTNRKCLVFHLMRVHGNGPELLCDLCPKTYRTKAQMTKHMGSHMKKVFACNICDYKTAWKENLGRHKKIHLKHEKCRICNKQVASLKEHLRIHKKESCPLCNKIISTYQMKKHIKDAHHDERWKCSDCSSTFSTEKALRRHKLEQHYEGKLHRCHCGSVFKTKANLKSHQLVHDSRKLTCEVCGQKFAHLPSLGRHYRKHHLKTHGPLQIQGISGKPKALNHHGKFVCDKCGTILKTRNSFMNHFYSLHSIKSRFSCDLCPKSFNYKYRLEYHMQGNHLNVNPFTCKFCGHKSTAKSSLKKHMLMHEPKTECKVCHRMVTNIYEHMRGHVKVKCPFCAITLSKPWLPVHIKTVHKSKELKKV